MVPMNGWSGRVRGGPGRQLIYAGLVFLVPVVIGTVGYTLLGLGPFTALYQTIITVATVGYAEIDGPYDTVDRIFTIALILVGVVSVAYAFGLVLDLVVENRIARHFSERRMSRAIESMTGHLVVCGLGRVGRTIADEFRRAGRPTVVIDVDPARIEACELPHVLGDATDDAVLRAAGVERAATLVVALDSDEANLYVTLSARVMNPSLFIVSRARDEAAGAKLQKVGANRVVNPQLIGGDRMAAMALQPNVAEFLDVVMRERGIEFRLEELAVGPGSELDGSSLREAHIRDRTGALVLALRHADGAFTTNPSPELTMRAGDIVIAIGTQDQLGRLGAAAAARP
jgi:voltage-gated potassium channel